MKISRFFEDVLGAKLKNQQWSWGAADSLGRLFLRVWRDQIRNERVLVALNNPWRKSHGYPERLAQLEEIQNGKIAFGVVCIAVNPNSKSPAPPRIHRKLTHTSYLTDESCNLTPGTPPRSPRRRSFSSPSSPRTRASPPPDRGR